LPHSEIPGSKPARGSPGLVAACHVLRRLLAPRHPPGALPFPRPRPAATALLPRLAGPRARRREECHHPWRGQSNNTHTPQAHLTAGPCSTAERRLSIPMPKPAAPEDGKTEKKRARQDTLASARPRAASREASRARGRAPTLSPPHDVQRTNVPRLTPPPAWPAGRLGTGKGFPCGNRPPAGTCRLCRKKGRAGGGGAFFPRRAGHGGRVRQGCL
jgi:hypothetical protein